MRRRPEAFREIWERRQVPHIMVCGASFFTLVLLQLLSEEGSGNTVSGKDVLKRYLKLSDATFSFCFCLCSWHSHVDDTKWRPETKSIVNAHDVANQNFVAVVSVHVRVVHLHWTTVLSVFGREAQTDTVIVNPNLTCADVNEASIMWHLHLPGSGNPRNTFPCGCYSGCIEPCFHCRSSW